MADQEVTFIWSCNLLPHITPTCIATHPEYLPFILSLWTNGGQFDDPSGKAPDLPFGIVCHISVPVAEIRYFIAGGKDGKGAKFDAYPPTGFEAWTKLGKTKSIHVQCGCKDHLKTKITVWYWPEEVMEIPETPPKEECLYPTVEKKVIPGTGTDD